MRPAVGDNLGPMSTEWRRRLHLLLPSDDGQLCLSSDTGGLPVVDVEVAPGEPTSAGAAREVAAMGLQPWVVDCLVDQREHTELAQDREALIELPPAPASWAPPAGTVWRPWATIEPSVAQPLVEPTRQRLAECAGDRPVPATRAPWSRPGWFESARSWIEQVVADAGRGPVEQVEQMRLWGLTCVMRVTTRGGRLWFKATIAMFHAEARVTAALAEISDGATGGVVAIDDERGWMLLEELGESGVESPTTMDPAIDRLTALQAGLVGDPRLATMRLPERPLAELPEALDALLDAPIVRGLRIVDGDERRAVRDGLTAAVERMERVGFPTTLAHCDLHPGNVAASSDGPVLFDWSDANLTSPVVEMGPWASWYPEYPDRLDHVWSTYRSAWRRHLGVALTDDDRADVERVNGAFHAATYLRILESVEPIRRHELIDGLEYFLDLALG